MTQRAGQACRSIWERRELRLLAAFGSAAIVVVFLGVVRVPPALACLPNAPANTALPVLSPANAGRVGTVLSTTDGSWQQVCSPLGPISYQWYRGSNAISGATSYTYTTVSADAGSEISVRVTKCDNQSDCATVTSAGILNLSSPLGAPGDMPIWSHGPVEVNDATGNVVLSVPTPSYATATGSLGFSLTYNSQGGAGIGGVGTGWVLSTGDTNPPARVHDHGKDPSPSPSAEVDSTDGSLELYQQVAGSNTYVPLQVDGSQLTRHVSGTNTSWTLIDGDGSSYTFNTEDSSGNATLNSATVSSPSGNGQLSYSYSSGKVTSVSYKETPTSSSPETLAFDWSCTGYLFCVTGPDGVQWKYTANGSNQITEVNDGTRNLVALTYTSGLVTKIQNADDLDPPDASPGYNSSHTLTLTYDSASPKRLACLIDGPISGQAASSQPSCAGGGTASKSTWSFNYNPTCPTLKAPAVGHTVAQGTRAGCTTVTDPDQQPSGPGITVLYDTFNRPLEYDDARLGSGHERISLVQYNAQNQIAWSEDPDGSPTDYSYDPISNELLAVTGPSPASGVARPVTSYRYDEQTIGTASTAGNALTGLAGTYWTNTTTLTGLPVARETDPAPGSGTTTFGLTAGSGWPPSGVSSNTSGFSARWTGEVTVPQDGLYTFTTTSHDSTHGVNDGTHLVIDGQDAIENMSSPASPASSGSLWLTAGSVHQITLEYAHSTAGTSGANVSLKWACPACTPVINQQNIPVSDLAPEWGNQTSVVSPAGRISFQHFLDQASGQPDYSLVRVGSQNLITSYVYDSLGRITKRYMPKANASATINSTTGNLTSTPDTNYETDYTYYGDGSTAAPPSVCGGGSAVNQYGQLESTSNPNGGLATDTTVYNSAGLPVASTNGTGTSCLTRDAESRLTSETPHGDQSHPVSYTYDPNGNALTTTNQNGTVTTYYDEAGRLNDTTDASGAEAHFTYDEDGNILDRIANTVALSGTTCPSSSDYCTTYSYDAADEQSGETDAAGNSWSFFYDTRGNLRGTLYPNGTFSWVDTDPAGDISDVFNRHGTISSTNTTAPSDSNPLADYSYTYVDGSNVYQDGKKVTEARTSGSTTQNTSYTYDAVGRLSVILLPTGTCRDYSFDLDSNRTQIQESPTGCSGTFSTTATYTYDPSTTTGIDELTNTVFGGSTTNYGYDSDGRTTSEGTTGFSWNGLNQFATATVGSNTVTYTYDPTGALMSRVSSSPATTTTYLLGDLFETDGSGTITTSYTDGPAGDLASYNGPPTSSSTATYLYYDAHGSAAAEADSSGTLISSHTYDPFGGPLDSLPSNTTTHRFTGRWDKPFDTATGLVLMGARPYDPTTGRFLSVDPVPGGSLNNYDYAGQDPINNYDLTGTRATDEYPPVCGYPGACDDNPAEPKDLVAIGPFGTWVSMAGQTFGFISPHDVFIRRAGADGKINGMKYKQWISELQGGASGPAKKNLNYNQLANYYGLGPNDTGAMEITDFWEALACAGRGGPVNARVALWYSYAETIDAGPGGK
jgi:RHS repeat-associated protein